VAFVTRTIRFQGAVESAKATIASVVEESSATEQEVQVALREIISYAKQFVTQTETDSSLDPLSRFGLCAAGCGAHVAAGEGRLCPRCAPMKQAGTGNSK
jgi:hypothetical protein